MKKLNVLDYLFRPVIMLIYFNNFSRAHFCLQQVSYINSFNSNFLLIYHQEADLDLDS